MKRPALPAPHAAAYAALAALFPTLSIALAYYLFLSGKSPAISSSSDKLKDFHVFECVNTRFDKHLINMYA